MNDYENLVMEYRNSSINTNDLFITMLNENQYPNDIIQDIFTYYNNTHKVRDLSFMLDIQTFTNYINKHYIYPGQSVKNTETLYTKINLLPISKRNDIIELLCITSQLKFQNHTTKITRAKNLLLEIINNTLFIENGHPSELWFAILCNGKVCGSTTDNNIETDIEKDGIRISLKNYKKMYNIDFGGMDKDFVLYLRKFISLAELMTGQEVDSCVGRIAVNNLLRELEEKKYEKNILEYSENAHFKENDLLFKYIKELSNIFEERLSMTEYFFKKFNELLRRKLYTVDWWCFVINDVIYMRQSTVMYKSLQSRKQLKNGIKNFKSNKLYVNINRLEEHE